MIRIVAVVLLWSLVALVSASQVYVASRSMGHDEAGFLEVAWWVAPVWLVWALFTPAIVWLARAFPIERGRLARAVPIHALAGTGFALAHLALWLAWTQAVSPYRLEDRPWAEMYWVYVQGRFNVSFLVYWAVVGAAHAVTYAARLRQREVDASRLTAQLSEARLAALRARVHPHFLFNTLHAISTLVGRDVARAREMIARLSDLLRLSLERDAAQEITLREELEYIDLYLDIEQSRFGDRLEVDFAIDPDTLDARVPNLILQPLVENAIRHGIAWLEEPGTLRIAASRANGRMELSIVNDLPAPATGPQEVGRGIGLGSLGQRLEALYGPDHQLEARRAEGRFEVRLELPFRSAGGVG
ncbi:MAG TPA: histidine kinase [Gemmatimonadota bacterium]|nr:histidine kinase [Gemmatimonadota bacterium]